MVRVKTRPAILLASALASGVLPAHCTTTLEDAVLQGVSQFVTDATAGLLSSFLPFDVSGGDGGGGGGDNGGGDPFGNPPVQS